MRFQVVGYGADGGQLFKYVSTDGSVFTPIGTDVSAKGNYQFPLPTGATEVYFRLQVGTAHDVYDGVMVDNFHAELLSSPQPAVSQQEGVGAVCDFGAPPFCPVAVPTFTEWGLITLAVLAAGGVVWTVVRRRRMLSTA